MHVGKWIYSSGVSPREARALLSFVLKKGIVWLWTHPDFDLTASAQAQANQLVSRRKAGEPMAYLLEQKEFYGRSFRVNEYVLIPRPETELMIDLIQDRFKPGKLDGKWLDLGTGSGCLAVTLALIYPNVKMYAVDLSEEALTLASDNARMLQSPVVFLQSYWFNTFQFGVDFFNLVVSNPPYIKEDDPHLTQDGLCFEPKHALVSEKTGLSDIVHIVSEVPKYLQKGGWLYLEHGYNQKNAVYQLFHENGFSSIESVRDLSGQPRVMLGQYL